MLPSSSTEKNAEYCYIFHSLCIQCHYGNATMPGKKIQSSTLKQEAGRRTEASHFIYYLGYQFHWPNWEFSKHLTTESWVPKGGCDPMGQPLLKQVPGRTFKLMERGIHTGAGLLAGVVTQQRTHNAAVYCCYTLWKGCTLEEFMKNCSLCEGQ